MSLTFVNHNGDPITDSRMAAMRAQGMELERQRRLAAKADPVSVHKGWRVSGIAPGLLDEAKQAHERLCQMAQKAGGKPPEPFDETAWLRTAKRTALRSNALHPSGGSSTMQGAGRQGGMAGSPVDRDQKGSRLSYQKSDLHTVSPAKTGLHIWNDFYSCN